MKKYIKLNQEREKLELKIAELISKFSLKNGLVITKIEPSVDINITNDNKTIFLYSVKVTGEI